MAHTYVPPEVHSLSLDGTRPAAGASLQVPYCVDRAIAAAAQAQGTTAQATQQCLESAAAALPQWLWGVEMARQGQGVVAMNVFRTELIALSPGLSKLLLPLDMFWWLEWYCKPSPANPAGLGLQVSGPLAPGPSTHAVARSFTYPPPPQIGGLSISVSKMCSIAHGL